MTSCRLACLLAALLGAGAGVRGQAPALSFQATLESIRIDAQPGQVATRQFRLTLDPKARETHFTARVEDWWRSEDGAQSFYGEAGTLRHSCGRWVTLNPVASTIKGGETLTIRVTVSVPGEMASGGYWCALTVDEVPDPRESQDGVGVRFVASVSTGIFVNVGEVQRAAKIIDLTVGRDAAFIRVRNDGNAPVGLDGWLEFFAAGATVPTARAVVPRGTILTEPSIQGTLVARLPGESELPSGRYRVRVILDYGASHYIGAERDVEVLRSPPAGDPDSR